MLRIVKPRLVIDRKALLVELDSLFEGKNPNSKDSAEILELFKNAKAKGWAEINRRFERDNVNSIEIIKAHAYLIDQLIRSICDFAVRNVFPSHNPTTGDRIALLATGGYGRGELAPFSDVDLMFLLPYKLTPRSEQLIEHTLYMLWDLGLKVGHATRSLSEALRLAKEDLTIRTSLLEARWLWGNTILFSEFQARFRKEIIEPTKQDFVSAKLAERDDRHMKMDDSRYVLEPNVKEGKGALRDLQTLFWIIKYLYDTVSIENLLTKKILTKIDARLFKKATKFFWTVRCHLHYVSGRQEERLTFDIQEEIGKRMRYRDSKASRGVERFMKHYFLMTKDVGDLTRNLCSVIENELVDYKHPNTTNWFFSLRPKVKKIRGYSVDRGYLRLSDSSELKKSPEKLLELFHVAQKHDLYIHPVTLRLVTQNLKLIDKALRKNKEANKIFSKILLGKEPDLALSRLNDAGVMGRFITEFGRVVAQMQYDMYHVYTVDEHTIRAVGVLSGIETKALLSDHPLACLAVDEISSRRVLYFAVLLHDIAKGRGGDHSQLGSEIAKKLGPRFGLSNWETQTLAWLVRYHLLMSNLAFKRDIEDPKTVIDFVDIVQSPERLRLLLLLTVADIRAVGPNVWNSWKASLLRELYWRAQEVFSGVAASDSSAIRIEKAKTTLREALPGWTEKQINEHIKNCHDRYWLELDIETQKRLANLVFKANFSVTGFELDFYSDTEKEIVEVSVYAPDHPGLFASIAGAISLSGASIANAKIQTLKNGMALDSFSIRHSHIIQAAQHLTLSKLEGRISRAIQGEIDFSSELLEAGDNLRVSKKKAFNIASEVIIDNNASQKNTVIEVNGTDRIGFLHDVTASLTNSGLQISSAHIATYGEKVVDVFYVRDVFGHKIENPDKLEKIRQLILESIKAGTHVGKNTPNANIKTSKQKSLVF